jgi:predicted ATPase/class 3 adenylate cyclase
MTELPTGTVTFLFTDIEGSTRLLQELGDGYSAVLDEHAAIAREAISHCGGVEFGTEGDSFFAAFRTAAEAVSAAVAMQRNLSAKEWSGEAVVRVRMGLHTGEGVVGALGYVGMDVHRAARVADAAHGGQVLLSEATRGLVEHALPEGTTLRDLGQHRLKDIAYPEHLYDLLIEGLPCDFPPPRSLDARPNNLPLQLTSFVGREREFAKVKDLLGQTRLLTLTGAGGTGKTRLSLEVAAQTLTEYRDGAFFVDLSSVTDPDLVASAIAEALGVSEVPGRAVLDVVKEHLETKELLLVLDNFEQVAQAAPVVEALLTVAPGLKALVTSRVVLSLRGEQEYAVPPLEPPRLDDLADVPSLLGVEAVRLFVDRALAVSPRFELTRENAPAVAAITARLDGLPLAIELAATRTKVLTPEEMLPRLQQRLSVLTSGPRTLPERQRTLRDAIAWSHDLLGAPERELFARLSVFTGGWSLESAEAVCDPEGAGVDPLEGLASLVDQSLVRRSEGDAGEARFSMLETIREFGLEELRTSGELEEIRRRHAEYFLDLSLEAEPHLTGGDQVEWLDRCDRDHANIRAALEWAIEAGDADRAQESAGALWRFWQQRGHLAEGRGWFEVILAMPSGRDASPARAKALIGAGGMAWWQQDRDGAGACYEEAVAIERELGDPVRLAEALYNLSFVVAGDSIESAAVLLEETLELFRGAGNEFGVAQTLAMLVIRDAQAGDWSTVIAKLEETTGIWRRLGERLHLAFDLVWLAFSYGRVGRGANAKAVALEALELFCEVDNATGIGITLVDLAFLADWEGHYENALRLAGASESIMERAGGPPGGFAGLLEGDPVREARVHLSEEVADRAWDEGRAMSTDEAVTFARGALEARIAGHRLVGPND